MNPYLQEVLNAYVPIERWLSQGGGSAEALMIRSTAEFIMIPPGDKKMNYPVVSCFFHHAGATHPGLHIMMNQVKIISEQRDGAAARYRESQTLVDGSKNVY